MKLKIFLVLGCIVGLAAQSQKVAAATTTTTFQVLMTIGNSCVINSANNLNFGSSGPIVANVDATSTLSVQCTLGLPYNIGLSAGTGTGATVASRLMTGPASATILYALYSDVTRLLVWGETIGVNTTAGVGTGNAVAYTVYGRVPPQTTPGAGSYADTITITVTY